MRSICCAMAVLVCGVSFAEKRRPAPLTTSEVEYPLSCNEAAKPLVLEAWNALVHERPDDATEQLTLALRADPRCVMARASLPGGKPFDPGAAKLHPLERLHLQVIAARRQGQVERALGLGRQLRQRAPHVMMANLVAAQTALDARQWQEAALDAHAATELTPMNGAGWYLLGQAQLQRGFVEEARAAFLKYAEVAPAEANAHAALGDALVASDELGPAAASYQRAIDRSKGRQWRAWRGVATVMALTGDWTSARAAIATLRAASAVPADQQDADVMLAWSYAAEGRMTEALHVAGTLRARPLLRAELLLANGNHPEALAAFTALEGRAMSQLERARSLAGLTVAQARLGKTAAAANTLRRLERMGTAPAVLEQRAYARGALALAQRAPRRALESLRACTEAFDPCTLLQLEALQDAGETAEALDARAALARANHADPRSWFIHEQLTRASGVASTRGPNSPAR